MKRDIQIRQSNIELLRLIIMSMIVVHHGLFAGLGLVGMADWSEAKLVLPNNALVCAWGGDKFISHYCSKCVCHYLGLFFNTVEY